MNDLEARLTALDEPVDDHIDPDEGMLDGPRSCYFESGASALRCIRLALLSAERSEVARVLDLPCGHGRVLRYLCRAFPSAEFVASDVLQGGVDFCARRFCARPVLAATDPDRTELEGPFDLIWCGSLFTHLPLAGWNALARRFREWLSPGGVMVISLHGRWVAERMRGGVDYGLGPDRTRALLETYAAENFAYEDYPDTPGYGISLSRLSWAIQRIEQSPDLRVVWSGERQWDDHHDVVAIQRIGGD